MISPQAAHMRVGLLVFGGLAVLTVTELVVSAAVVNPLPLLAVIALIKAGLIIRFFMHVAQLWRKEA